MFDPLTNFSKFFASLNMFTKEGLLSMNYKELVVLAKEHGVYKSRSKKVYLLKQLLPLTNNELFINQKNEEYGSPEESVIDKTRDETLSTSPTHLRRETFDINPHNIGKSVMEKTENETSITKMTDAKPIPLRRETFDVDQRSIIDDGAAGKKCSIKKKKSFRQSTQRRETFEVNPRDTTMSAEPANNIPIHSGGENISLEERGRISILRQNTFSIDKPKENATPVKALRTSVLRQNTFSIDSKVKGTISDEMPGLICKDITNRSTIRPFFIKESPGSLVKFRSPIRTRNSVSAPLSVGNVRSIAKRLEELTVNRELRPSSREGKQQKAEGAGTPARVHKTAIKGGRIQKKITPRKLPNFKAIHLREFSKMESIVDHTQRKAERTQTLMTPVKLNSTGSSSRIPVKFDPKLNVTPATMPVKPIFPTHNRGQRSLSKAASNIKSEMGLRKSQCSNLKDKLKLKDSPMTKLRMKSASAAASVASKDNLVPNSKKRVNNVKEIVSAKSHPFSVERNRAKGRDLLKTVRTNRRFQLQMEVMRKAKV